MRKPNYDRSPTVQMPGTEGEAWSGWPAVAGELRRALAAAAAARGRAVLAVECTTGLLPEVREQLRALLQPDLWLDAQDALRPPAAIEAACAPWLGGDDPLFGCRGDVAIETFLDPERSAELHRRAAAARGTVVVFGTGACCCCAPDLLVFADLPRWEGQLRQRAGTVSNLGTANAGSRPSLQYKRSWFVDWRVVDRLKQETLARWDYLLDTTAPATPNLVTGRALRRGLDHLVTRPFRLVPFFDPAPWGGQWMQHVCGLPPAPNYGWCFDCVPEENSLRLSFGGVVVEMPALNLVFGRPRELLGHGVFARFGAEFPIRFDFLDTMGGGHLSLQVHPLADYVRREFGMPYTQDESYYLLDAGPDATVFLGLCDDVDPRAMLGELEAAQRGGPPFQAERHVARWPARRHDHFLIPAGTVHCSGRNAMVLEISATPYLFTFKLWDWGRPGLDGLPRPINLGHGAANIQWDRRASWVARELVNRVEPVGAGPGWREERTGLHALEFLETRRHWFTGTAPHDTAGTVHVLNLVQGDAAIVESPDGAFAPFVVHYAETFVVPAAVGSYTLRPFGPAQGTECATVQASVRGT